MTSPRARLDGDRSEPTDDGVAAGQRVLNAEAFAALTGVRAERLRTWQRRHGFPAVAADVLGHRGFRAIDAPRVVAACQLIDAGEPVAAAIERVRHQITPDLDEASLARAFGAAATPVVAIGGPAPLQIVWANAAALALANAPVELPAPVVDRGAHWRRLLVDPPTEPVWSVHGPWFGDAAGGVAAGEPDPVSAVVWAAGAPAFVPAVLVVVDVPVSDETPPPPPKPDERAARASDQRCAAAVGAARRALQRGTGRQALADSLGALVTSELCVDAALLVTPQGKVPRPALSACGRHELMRPADDAAAHLRVALDGDVPVQVVEPDVREQLAIEAHEHGLVVPLVAGGQEFGYLLVITSEPIDVTDDCEALVMALGASIAASMSRNRALRELRRLSE